MGKNWTRWNYIWQCRFFLLSGIDWATNFRNILSSSSSYYNNQIKFNFLHSSETKLIEFPFLLNSSILLWYSVITVQLFGKQISHYHKFYLLHENYTYNRKFRGRFLKNNIPTIIIFLYLSIYGPDQYGFWVTQMHKVQEGSTMKLHTEG